MIERQRFSPAAQLALLLVLTGFGYILAEGVSVFIAQAWLPHNLPAGKLQDALLKNVALNRWLQVVGTFIWFIIPAIIFTTVTNGGLRPRYLGFSTVISGKQMFLVVVMFFASFFIGGALELINQRIPLTKGLEATFRHWEDEYNQQAAALGTVRSGGEYIIALFMLALLPAIAEEMLFRGCLQKVMINLTKNVFIGIFISSILFSLMHGSWYGFLFRLFLGGLLGYIYYYSKNIWLNIAMHFLNNAFVVTEMYAQSKGGAAMGNDPTGKNVPILNFLFIGIMAAVGLYYLFKVFRQESELVIAMHNSDNLFNDDQINNV